mmetsp:Transcript_10754/g.28308  ORF Transcript_10754/g.28308 Transcript_10754/m.28308 type:complete len:261 (-) Transcript_10754:20-802(-)
MGPQRLLARSLASMSNSARSMDMPMLSRKLRYCSTHSRPLRNRSMSRSWPPAPALRQPPTAATSSAAVWKSPVSATYAWRISEAVSRPIPKTASASRAPLIFASSSACSTTSSRLARARFLATVLLPFFSSIRAKRSAAKPTRSAENIPSLAARIFSSSDPNSKLSAEHRYASRRCSASSATLPIASPARLRKSFHDSFPPTAVTAAQCARFEIDLKCECACDNPPPPITTYDDKFPEKCCCGSGTLLTNDVSFPPTYID